MSASADTALGDRVNELLAEIAATEAARPLVADEIAAEMARLDLLKVRAEASTNWYLSTSPVVSESAVDASIAAAMMLVAPAATMKIATERVRRRCAGWTGLRMSNDERERRLVKLRADLRAARAQAEQQRRAIEARTGEVLPRAGDDPSVWLLNDQPLAALAEGRTP